MYGGYGVLMVDINPAESLYVLDIKTYRWYIPKISGNIPNTRYYHKANVIGKYMVISFGNYVGFTACLVRLDSYYSINIKLL